MFHGVSRPRRGLIACRTVFDSVPEEVLEEHHQPVRITLDCQRVRDDKLGGARIDVPPARLGKRPQVARFRITDRLPAFGERERPLDDRLHPGERRHGVRKVGALAILASKF